MVRNRALQDEIATGTVKFTSVQTHLAEGRRIALGNSVKVFTTQRPIVKRTNGTPQQTEDALDKMMQTTVPMVSKIYKGIAACYTHLHNRNRTLYDKTYARTTERATDLLEKFTDDSTGARPSDFSYLDISNKLYKEFNMLSGWSDKFQSSGLWK